MLRTLEYKHVEYASGLFPPTPDLTYDEVAWCPGAIVKNEKYTQIRRIVFRGQPAYIKVTWGNPLVRLRTMGASDRGGREFRMLETCRNLGIAVPKPLGHGVRRTFWGVVLENFVVIEAFEGAQSLADWLKAYGADAANVAGFDELIRDLSSQLRTIHASGIYFVRPSAKDILIRQTPDGARFDFRLLDVPAARQAAADWRVRIGQRRDIAALLVTIHRHTGLDVTESFLTGYLPDPLGKSPEELVAVAREGIARRSRKSAGRRLKAFARRALHFFNP